MNLEAIFETMVKLFNYGINKKIFSEEIVDYCL